MYYNRYVLAKLPVSVFMVTVSQNYTGRIIMAKKTSGKKHPKVKVPKANKIVTSSKDDCDGR